MIKECKHCKKEFEAKRSNVQYCTRTCKNKSRWVRYREVRNASDNPMKQHGGNHTGKTGKEHYAYKDGNGLFKMKYAKEYYIKKRYCERCDKDLQDVGSAFYGVHHKDHDRSNNEESNFELLCKRCHQIEHECWKAFD